MYFHALIIFCMKYLLTISLLYLFSSMKTKQKIDLLIYNASVYTVDSNFSKAEAIAVDKGKVIAVGNSKDLQDQYDATENIDAKGNAIFPGLMDAHSHFLDFGLGLNQADLVGTTCWDDVIE